MEELGAAWLAAMLGGDFEGAWRISDRVLAELMPGGPDWTRPRHEQWIWDGRSLAGQRVLVRCYHGLGDTLQFARFLPRLANLAREVTVWAQPALLPLLGTLPAPLRLLPLHDGTPDVEYDVDIEIMELAHAFRVSPAELAEDVPYFRVESAPRFDADICVGVIGQSGGWNPARSVPAAVLAGLTEAPACVFFNLELDRRVPGMRDTGTPDVLRLAQRLRALDLVISVDTMVAHLAGALGVPTWTLLAFESDWRWLRGRDDSPWYPGMRLYRQRVAGDWQSVLERVRSDLQALRPLAGRRAG